MMSNAQILIEKLQSLPPERMAEVDDFIDFLRLREQQRSLTSMAAQISAPVFAAVWDNPEDEAYDEL
jgi:hypothetical protein